MRLSFSGHLEPEAGKAALEALLRVADQWKGSIS